MKAVFVRDTGLNADAARASGAYELLKKNSLVESERIVWHHIYFFFSP